MLLRQLYHTGLAQASYLIGCQTAGEALVVDPNRDVEQYLAAAKQAGLRIVAVTETHIHADYLSGARELAQATGATLYLSGAGPAEWQYAFASEAGARLLREGDVFHVGKVRVEVLHTPGHTPEHLALLITDTAGANAPMGLCSGDFVFVGDVGRPDLLERAAGVSGAMDGAARELFASLARFRALPEYLQVWPGHGAGSACGKALGAVPQTTVGYEMRFNWALRHSNEQAFVREVLEDQPPPPPYFARMKGMNRDGPPPRPAMPPQLPAQTLEEGGALVIDVRPLAESAAGYLPGGLRIPAGDSFTTWAGWLLPDDRPLALLGEIGAVERARADLMLIGLDNLAGWWSLEALAAYQTHGGVLSTPRAVDVAGAGELVASGAAVLDVRNPSEHAAGHIPGSINIPLGQIAGRLSEIPTTMPVLVHCQSGFRSAVAGSLLHAHGRTNIVELSTGFGGWQRAGMPVER